MTRLTLAQAVSMTGLSRSTLNRATKSGKLSAHRNETGAIHIDASELARVFPMTSPEPAQRRTMTSHDELRDEGMVVELAVLRAKLEAVERERTGWAQERETLGATVTDLRKRLDRSEERVLALSAPVAQAAPQPAPEVPAAIDEPRRRLEEAEARNQALSATVAPRRAQERPSEPPVGVTPPKGARSFLGRLLGR